MHARPTGDSRILVSIQRRPDGLFARHSRRATPFARPETRELAPDACPYEESWAPLERSHPLSRAWEALRAPRSLDAAARDAVRAILEATFPSPADVPPLRLDPPPAPPRRTAAHPRLYKGTRDRPPKRPRHRIPDLRPHLCSNRDVRLLWSALAPGTKPPSPPGVPPRLRWSLGLDRDDALRRCVDRLVALEPVHGPAWAALLEPLPPERRATAAELIVESGAASRAPAAGSAAEIRETVAIGSPDTLRHKLFGLLTAAHDPARRRLVLGAIRLVRGDAVLDLDDAGPIADVPFDAVRDLSRYSGADPWFAQLLWRRCSRLDGFGRLLESIAWRSLDPASARRLFEVLGSAEYQTDLNPARRARKWRAVRSLAPAIFEGVRAAAFRPKALRHVSELLWSWDDARSLRGAVEDYLPLLARLCAPPYSPSGHEEEAFPALTALPRDRFARVAAGAPWEKLERRCRRLNDARCIGAGLSFLARHEPAFIADALVEHPDALLRAAARVGPAGETVCRATLEAWRRHPLVGSEPSPQRIRELLPPGVANPVPRKLRDALEGRRALTAAQERRLLDLVRAALPRTRVDLMRWTAERELTRALGETDLHAARLYASADGNRRALRRLIQSRDPDFVPAHPINRAWLARHATLDARRWLDGVVVRRTLENGRVVELRTERDPLQALRMGTVVGSCTGVGGAFAHSAAAVVLDVNKQVVYARDPSGLIVGRQVIAISEDGRLVAYAVYPAGAPADLKRAFRDYDAELAAALGIRWARDGDVRLLVANDWFDDGPWDRKTR